MRFVEGDRLGPVHRAEDGIGPRRGPPEGVPAGRRDPPRVAEGGEQPVGVVPDVERAGDGRRPGGRGRQRGTHAPRAVGATEGDGFPSATSTPMPPTTSPVSPLAPGGPGVRPRVRFTGFSSRHGFRARQESTLWAH